jgi:hypothetical protein
VTRGVCLAVVLALGLGLSVLLPGCAKSQGVIPPRRIDDAPVPAYADLRRAYNARCERLDRLRAPATLVIESTDDAGARRKDQVESYLAFAAPANLSLRVDKVGQTLAVFGSNDEFYWWIDLSESPTVALVGTHAAATPASGAALGIPLHPLDLVDALGVLPLPDGGRTPPAVRRSARGQLLVELPPRAKGWGARRVYIDERTTRPERIEIVDAAGRIVLTSVLSRYVNVDADRIGASMASRYVVDVPGQRLRITVSVASPENPGTRLRTRGFDLPALLEAYGVARVVDLDAEARR